MDVRKKPPLLFIAQGAVVAAAYVALTIVFEPISFKESQVRIAEALTILPMFTAAAVPGLAVGCLLANIVCGAALPDVIFGSFATFLGAVGTRRRRRYVRGIDVGGRKKISRGKAPDDVAGNGEKIGREGAGNGGDDDG